MHILINLQTCESIQILTLETLQKRAYKTGNMQIRHETEEYSNMTLPTHNKNKYTLKRGGCGCHQLKLLKTNSAQLFCNNRKHFKKHKLIFWGPENACFFFKPNCRYL